MVEFSRYVQIAYEVAESKGFASQLRGSGTQQVNRTFLSQLAEAYNELDHSEASEASATKFLEENLGPP
jgi:hypothetical protein